MYKTVVFDLDGTLLDTLDDLADAVNFALAQHALPTRSVKEIRAFLGNGMANLIQNAAGGAEDTQEILATFKARYAAHSMDKTKPYEGVMELLAELKKQGIKTAILSNKADFAVQPLTKKYFGALIDAAQGENEAEGVLRKPDAGGVYEIMKKLNATAAETVFVGDSEVDIRTAENAGVDCISVTWGFRDEEELRKNGAKTLVSEPLKILDLCK
ncbi:MAG: HAD family hydrolase [Clostridia bacterium]|nr:HAD family hydrolase [Clostridia bacterium]